MKLSKINGKLEDALILLGEEVEPQSWPEEPEPPAVLKADINEDGVVDFQDFAVLTDHWLESSEIE